MKTHAPPPHATSKEDEDACELAPFVRAHDAAELQAALWATRRHEGLDAAAQAELDRWLAEDPRHRELYEELERSLDPVRELPDDDVQALKAGLGPDATAAASGWAAPVVGPRPAQVSSGVQSPGRRAWMLDLSRLIPPVAMASVAAAGWIGWDTWSNQATWANTFTTGRGEFLNVDLPDGSVLQLDTATRVQVALYRRRREVRLLEGQAMFSVQGDSGTPFEVLAGNTRVTVVGTRFSVRHAQTGLDAGKTSVAVEAGRVRVARADGSDRPQSQEPASVLLTAGQGVTARADGRLERVVAIAIGAVGAWRTRRVNFNDTPLTEALAEFERYGPTGLRLQDAAVGALRVGGSFDLRQASLFASVLPRMLPVRLERQGAATVITATK